MITCLVLRVIFRIFDKINFKILSHKKRRRVIINTNLNSLIETIRTLYKWKIFLNLCYYSIVLTFYNKNRKIWILNKIPSFSVISFQSDTSITTEFIFFFETHLNVNVIRNLQSYLLGLYKSSTLSNTSCKIKESDNFKNKERIIYILTFGLFHYYSFN